jgi:hypothetical protein
MANLSFTINGTTFGLINPYAVSGKNYYFIDFDNDGKFTNLLAGSDVVQHSWLDSIFNGGSHTTSALNTRSTTVSTNGLKYTLILPTTVELAALKAQTGSTTPNGWGGSTFWSADNIGSNHVLYNINGNATYERTDSEYQPTALQVTVEDLRPQTINLGTYSSSNGSLTLNLIKPQTVDGSTYYYLDASGNGGTDSSDAKPLSLLNELAGKTLGGYKLEIPSLSELQSLRAANNGLPSGWGGVAPAYTYWSSGSTLLAFADGRTYDRQSSESQFVALKVAASDSQNSSLYSLIASNSSVNEGSSISFVLRTTNVASGTSVDYSIDGISSDDIVGGSTSGSVIVGSNGQATITVALKADMTTEGSETLTVNAQNASASTTVNDTSITLVPTYALSASSSLVNEGSSVSFVLRTTNVSAGTSVDYSINGISSDDIVGGSTSGSVVVGSNGQATISVALKADMSTEGSETLTVTAQNASASTTVKDTSLTPVVDPTYALTASNSSVNEGSSTTFVLKTTGVSAGSNVDYSIDGISSDDIVGGNTSGSFVVGSNGQATISVALKADMTTEGSETLTVRAKDLSASTTVNDTSITLVPTYALSASSSTVNEGAIAKFTLTTKNVAAGTSLGYSINGVSSDDITGGDINGTVVVGSNGLATISVPIVADKTTEGVETLTVSVEDKTASTMIIDSSTTPVVVVASDPTYAITASTANVNEGSTAKFTVVTKNVAAGTEVGYRIEGLSSDDIVGGNTDGSVVIGSNGQGTISIALAADQVTEGNETLMVTVEGKSAASTVMDSSKSAPTYSMDTASGSITEGSTATYIFNTTGVAAGTKFNYTLTGTGISKTDVVGGKLTGTFAIGSDGAATITVPVAADSLTEGNEEMVLTVVAAGQTISDSVTVEDTSKSAVTAPTYVLTASDSAVKEGGTVNFTLETTNVAAGKVLTYKLGGVSAADVTSGKLAGTATVEDDGSTTISIGIAKDALTEGIETLTITMNGATAQAAILDDTSVSVSQIMVDGLYKTNYGKFVFADNGLQVGTTIDNYVPLKASASKDYVAAGVVALHEYSNNTTGIIVKSGTTYSEQVFTEAGLVKGAATKLTLTQLLAKEGDYDKDINGDGVVGDVVAKVVFSGNSNYGLYQPASGGYALAGSGLSAGSGSKDLVPLMVGTKAWTTKATVVGIADKSDGTISMILQTGTGAKAAFSEQIFTAAGATKGAETKLTLAQLLAREDSLDKDFTGDGVVGDGIVTVVDSNGSKDRGDTGLYKTLSGSFIFAGSGRSVNDVPDNPIVVSASAGKAFSTKNTIIGIAEKSSGYMEILMKSGSTFTAQKVNGDTGLLMGAAAKLSAADVSAREYFYDMDLNGDTLVSVVGQTTAPTGWAL